MDGGIASRLLKRAVFDGMEARLERRAAQEGTMMTTDRSGLIIGVVFSCLVFISVTIAARVLVRKMMAPNRFFLDDGLVLIASVLTLSLCMVCLEGTRHGLGQHEVNLLNHDPEVEDTIMLMWAGQLLYLFAISFAKFSIISSYFRIFPYKRLHQIIWVVLGVTIAFLFASMVATIFICHPIEAAWNPTLRTPTSCYRYIDLLSASAVVNILTDIVLCVLPLPYFLKLPLPLMQKISASFLFIAGGFAAIASVFRLSCLYEINNDGSDITYNITEPLIWSVLECTISIITISIPAMRPLFAKLAPSLFVANVAEDHKKLMDRISRHFHMDAKSTFFGRTPRPFSRTSRMSQLPILEKRLSTATAATDVTENTETSLGGRGRVRVIREETIIEEKA